MGRLSNSAGGSGWFFLTMLACLFCLVFPGPSIAQEHGSISGTVLEADGVTPVENLHVYAVTDPCDGMWLSGANTDENGYYTLTGIPEGTVYIRTCAECNDHPFVNQIYDGGLGTLDCDQGYYTTDAMPPGDVYIEACPRCDDFQFSNSWWTGPGNAGSTNCNDAWNLNLQAGENAENIDFTLEYPIFVEIHNRHRPGDLFDAYYGIYFFNFENTDDGSRVENASHTTSSAFTLSDPMSSSSTSPPAIDLDGWGAVFWRYNGSDITSLRIKVTDHDGIAYDGSSHQASAICNGEIFPLTYFYSDSAYEAYYEYWESGTAPAGEYVFTVIDPEGHSATVTDTLVVNPLPTADQAGFNLIPNGTSPTITWDPVPGADRYQFRIRDMNWNHVWNGFPRTTGSLSYTVPPGVLEPHTQYSYNIRARDHHYPIDVDNLSTCDNIFFTTNEISENPLIELDIGSGAARNPLIDIISVGAATRTTGDPVTANPETCLFFRVKVHDAQGVPGDIQSVAATFPGGSTIPLELDYNESATCGIYYAEDFNLPIAAGEYVITVTDLNGNTHSVTDTLEVNPILHPSDDPLNAVVDGTRVEVTWEHIAGAASYRLEIFDMEGNRLHRFGTTDNAHTIPAGYLKENTAYQYHIEAFRELFEQGVDNSSRSVMKTFQTGSNQEAPTQTVILTRTDPDITVSGGQNVVVYGTSIPNEITLESGAQAELINFPGSNLIIFQSDATLFTVSRSGTVVTFQGSDGTRLKIPAIFEEQTIMFNDKGLLVLRIHENQVRLNDQVIGLSQAVIAD